jgi:hypothetical protein
MRKVMAAAALLAFGAAPGAGAQETSAPLARKVHLGLAASVNPLGLQNVVEVSWSRPLSRSRSPLLEGAHLSFGLSHRLTPAYARGGAWVELAPLSVLELRAGAEPVAYFGTFHSLLPFSSYDDAFGDEARRARSGAEPGAALRVYAAPTVKARVGRLLLRSRADLEWWTARAPGPYFYEPFRDTLLQSSGDTLVATETVALWSLREEGRGRLLAGPVHELTVVRDAPRNRRQDVGVMGVWGLGARRLGLHDPVVYLKVVRYLQEPNRDGQVAAQVALGFALGKP